MIDITKLESCTCQVKDFCFLEHSKLDQDLAVNGERLTSLHAKLHQEVDKIRKWKNQTEVDLKQKVPCNTVLQYYFKWLQSK